MLWWHKSASFTSLGISFGPPRKLGLGNEVLQYTWLTHRENYDISQCLKYHSKCLIFGAKIQIGDTNKSLCNFFGIFFRGIFSHSVFFFLRVIFKPRMWILWETYHFLRHLLRNLRMFQLKNLSLQKGKRGMSPKGNFVKIVWQFYFLCDAEWYPLQILEKAQSFSCLPDPNSIQLKCNRQNAWKEQKKSRDQI